MYLQEYCRKHNLSQEKFADLIGVSPSHVCQIIKGVRSPSIHLISKIEVVTEGAVTLKDLIHPKAPSRLKNRKKKSIGSIKT